MLGAGMGFDEDMGCLTMKAWVFWGSLGSGLFGLRNFCGVVDNEILRKMAKFWFRFVRIRMERAETSRCGSSAFL